MKPVSDIHVSSNVALSSPVELLSRLPITDSGSNFIVERRTEIR